MSAPISIPKTPVRILLWLLLICSAYTVQSQTCPECSGPDDVEIDHVSLGCRSIAFSSTLCTEIGSSGFVDSIAYHWSFDQWDDFVNDPNPVYTFDQNGTYYVTLSIEIFLTDGTQCTSYDISNTLEVAIADGPDGFTMSKSCLNDVNTVYFSVPAIQDAQYFWDFGDGTQGMGPSPSHTYQLGAYGVELTTILPNGCTYTYNENININPSDVSGCDFFDINPQFEIEPTPGICGTYNFSYTNANIPFQGVKVLWNFGDGTTSNSPLVQHQYQTSGNYTVALTAWITETVDGICNKVCMEEVTEIISVTTPTVGFSHNAGCSSIQADFTAFASGNASITSYNWQIHNTGTGTNDYYNVQQPTINHVFGAPGTYEVTLEVNGANNCFPMSVTETVTVGSVEPEFSLSDICLGAVTPIVYDGDFEHVTGMTYSWDFGSVPANDAADDLTVPYPVQHYPQPGTYVVTLTVTPPGCPSIDYDQTIEVYDEVEADFSVPPHLCANETLTLTASAAGGNEWMWLVDGIQYSSIDKLNFVADHLTPGHYVLTPGHHSITLITKNGTCWDKISYPVEVLGPPQVDIVADRVDLCPGESVLLGARILNQRQGRDYSYEWSDGSTTLGTGANLSVSFAVGETDIYLTVSDDGCSGMGEGEADISLTGHERPEAYSTNIDPVTCPGGTGSAEVMVTTLPDVDDFTITHLGQELCTGCIQFTVPNLPAGPNFISVLPGSGHCPATLQVDIPDESLRVTDAQVLHSSCTHDDGSVSVTASGGSQSDYDFDWSYSGDPLWSNNTEDAISSTVSGLASGEYTVTITDGTCSIQRTYHVGRASLVAQVNAPSACGTDPVPVTVDVQLIGGGSGSPDGYKFTWSDGSPATDTTDPTDLRLLSPGNYTVTAEITSGKGIGCSVTKPFTVREGNGLTLDMEGVPPTCTGNGENGSAKAMVFNGTGPYSYVWDDGSDEVGTQAKIQGLAAGTYTVEVTDSRGCTVTDYVDLNAPNPLTVCSLVLSANSCELVASIDPGSGNPPFSYHFIRIAEFDDPPVTEEIIERAINNSNSYSATAQNLQAGSYRLEVIDSKGCSCVGNDTLELENERQNALALDFRYSWKHPGGIEPPVEPEDPKVKELTTEAIDEILEELAKCLRAKEAEFDADFDFTCMDGDNFTDELRVNYAQKIHHYTLYYYDRGNNLLKTVPPLGVKTLNGEQINALKKFRYGDGPAPGKLVPDHTHQTFYAYNSLGQLEKQVTPDGGRTDFLYDDNTQLRFSQNAQQQLDGAYSYSKYDKLGRIVETGESDLESAQGFGDLSTELAPDPDDPLESYPTLANQDLREITRTHYTHSGSVDYYGNPQRYLQNRVSWTLHDPDPTESGDESHIFYSYDPHGNVEWQVQRLPGFTQTKLRYEYDLVSGNVKQVFFNEQAEHRFLHRYSYDADNRIETVETSRNGYLWDRDASYDYYAHGPLRRTELGHSNIQGIDHVYTLQGWLKGLNHASLMYENDPGGDGDNAFPTDVFGMTLGYFEDDFNREYDNSGTVSYSTHNANSGNPYYLAANNDLYNGNISAWVTQVKDGGEADYQHPDQVTGRIFDYDALNRLKESDFHLHNGSAFDPMASDEYDSDYSYDANGNILALNRNSYVEGSNSGMDNMDYEYQPLTNRLLSVTDNNGNDDIDGLHNDIYGTHEYSYDATGNLIGESYQEWIEIIDCSPGVNEYILYNVETGIEWTVNGKVREVMTERNRVNSSDCGDDGTTTITFAYDALGNRISKKVKREGDDILDPEVKTTTTFYVRDASGNVMAIYERKNQAYSGTTGSYDYEAVFRLKETPIYGSDRIGQWQPVNLVVATVPYSLSSPDVSFDGDGVIRKGGLHNWFVPANQGVDIDGETACNCRFRHLLFDPVNNILESDKGTTTPFFGVTRNSLAVAEDLEGDLQFYTATAENYMGNENVCLLFSKEHKLIKGSSGIKSDARAKPVIIANPGVSGEYLLVTLAPDGRPYYHVVDMNLLGYGTTDNEGEVTGNNKNIPLDTLSYGLHMAGIEDHINGRHIVYMTQFEPALSPVDPGLVKIIAFEFTAGAPPVRHEVAQVNGRDPHGEGELKVAPNGRQLLLYNKQRQKGGFAHRDVDLVVIPLETNLVAAIPGANEHIAGEPSGSYGKASAEFAKNGNDIYFNQHGYYDLSVNANTATEKNILKHDGQSLGVVDNETANNTVEFGEVGRGNDNGMYLPGVDNEDEVQEIVVDGSDMVVSAHPTAVALPDDHFGLSGNLPSQVLKIYSNLQVRTQFTREVDTKVFELKNHLGNVMAVVSDRKLPVDLGVSDDYVADVRAAYDYYPFGMMMPGRTFNSPDYRYGFNGMEKDDELKGTGNSYTTHFRQYDSRIARWTAVDPKASRIPSLGSYNAMDGNPIIKVDPKGDLAWFVIPSLIVGYVAISELAWAPTGDETPEEKAQIQEDNDKAKVKQFVGTTVFIFGVAQLVGETGEGMIDNPDADEVEEQNEESQQSEPIKESKQRNKPKEEGVPNSSEIQSKDANGKTTKYSTYDENGKIVKEYRGEGQDHGDIPRPNVKRPVYNTNPETGETFHNGYEVTPAEPKEIP